MRYLAIKRIARTCPLVRYTSTTAAALDPECTPTVNSNNSDSDSEIYSEVAPVSMDTWHWTNVLIDAGARNRTEAEALVQAIHRIATFRIAQCEKSLLHQSQLSHELLMQKQCEQTMVRQFMDAAGSSQSAQISAMARLNGEINIQGDVMRDLVHATRTETALAVGELRTEGREEQQNVEEQMRSLTGQLENASTVFSSGTEHTKARSTFYFTGLLVMAASLIVFERTMFR